MAYDKGSADPEQEAAKSELLQALKAEEQWAASYLKSEIQESQIEALRRYYGDEYGDEIEGRSRVTTREVYEVIQWLRPDLRRTFTSGDKVFEFEGVTEASDQHAAGATNLVNYTFLSDNEGERELDAFIFDGLLQRIGVMGCEWKEAEYTPAQEVSGINTLQVMQLMQDPTTEIVEQEAEQGPPDEAHPDGVFYTLKIRKRAKDAYAEVFAIAPEDFRVAARTTDLQSARYAGDIVRMMRGEAKLKWPDYAEEIESHDGDTGGFNTDERRAERFRDLEGWDAGSLRDNGSDADEVEIMREYLRHDMDGDGYPEMIRVYRLGDCVLEYEEVDEHIYAHWTPNPIPHRLIGLSVADEAIPIQRTKTVLTRGFLDAINFAVVPRTYANTKMIGKRGLDALLTVRPGVIIEGEGHAQEALQPIVTPDVTQPALTGMQWMDRVLESRTGVSRSAQPMDPDMLHDTAKGVELLQNAASTRKEEIARNLAVGLQVLGMKLYRLIHKHQNEARAVKVAGAWKNIDPRGWEATVRCTVSVGLGTGAREKQLMMLQMIQADQVAWVGAYGPATPVVTPQHLHNLVAEKLRIMGYKTPDKYFGDPIDPQTGQAFVPQPPPDPNAAEAQADLQKTQMQLQSTERIEGLKVQATERQTVLQAEKDMQVATAQQRDEMVRVNMDAQTSAMEHERELIRLANDAEAARMTAALKARELDQKDRELDLKERELIVRQQEAAAQRDEAQADRDHQSQEGDKDRMAQKSKGATK